MLGNRLVGRLRARVDALLRGNAFLANVLKMFAGSAAAQAVSMALYPILTRIYTPKEMGIVAALTAASVMLIPFASLRMEMALPLARDRAQAGSVLVACFVSLIGTNLVLALILLALPASLLVRAGPVAEYRMFLPLGLLAFGGYIVLVYEATRIEDFASIARTRLYQALNGPVTQIVLGLLGFGSPGLCVGFVVGQAAGIWGLGRRLLLDANAPLEGVSLRSVLAAFATYRRFPLFSSWSGVLTASGANLVNLVFSVVYGPQIGGFMFLGERVLNRPLLLITTSVLQVFVGEFAKVRKTDPARLRPLFLSIVSKQAILSALWIGSIVAAAPLLIPLVFGKDWEPSVIYLQALAIYYLPGSVLHPVVHSLQILERQRLAAALDVSRYIMLVSAIAFCVATKLPPMTGVLLCSSVLACTNIASIVVTYRVVAGVSARARRNGDPLPPAGNPAARTPALLP